VVEEMEKKAPASESAQVDGQGLDGQNYEKAVIR